MNALRNKNFLAQNNVSAPPVSSPATRFGIGEDGRSQRGRPLRERARATALKLTASTRLRPGRSSIDTSAIVGGRTRGESNSRPYRENVVGFILNRRNDVLIMKRAGTRWHWQLPQGGVEPSETKRQAVLREMREETGLKGLRIIGVVENFHAYDWPKTQIYLDDEFRGQRQTLFFLRYTAKGLVVSLDPKEATGSHWVPIKDLLKWLAPVRHQMAKKALYSYQQLFTKKTYGGK